MDLTPTSASEAALWADIYAASFNTSPEEANALLSIGDIRHFSLKEENKLLAIATVVPVSCESLQGNFLYALAVAPEERGKGCFRELLHLLREQGETERRHFLCLIPASGRLSSTYRRHGYTLEVFRFPESHPASAKPIRCQSEEFLAFGVCDGCDFPVKKGLLLPLSDIQSTEFTFTAPMGEE